MAKKDKTDFFFEEEGSKEKEIVVKITKKLKLTVKSIVKGELCAQDDGGNMYRITITADKTSLKIGDTFSI